MMRNRILIITGGIVAIIFIAVITSLLLSKQKGQSIGTNPANIPTPITILTPVPTATTQLQKPISIVSTNPADGAQNVPINTTITITFNRTFSSNELSFAVNPNFAFSQSIQGNNLIITPKQNLDQHTVYTYTIPNTQQIPMHTMNFTTQGTGTINNPPIPDNESQRQDEFNKLNHPDGYLADRTPHTGNDFSVTSDLTNDSNAHFYFTVTLTSADKNQGQQDFMNWAISTGLTLTQVQNLDIRYQ